MKYIRAYASPIGKLYITSDGKYLTGIHFPSDNINTKDYIMTDLEIFNETIKWLDIYFSGKNPSFLPPYKLNVSPFRNKVLNILKDIPYGKTITYGEIAKRLAKDKKRGKMSAQAVGGAVSKNPIPIIIPCHRVVGSSGNLTGFSGGMKIKIDLLALEGNDMKKFFWKGK